MLNSKEKILYHQIHPFKLFTDWSTGLFSLLFFWEHRLIIAMLIAVVPSIVISILIIQMCNLKKYRDSPFGKYISKYMTREIEAIRFLGFGVMIIGAWYHFILLMVLGLLSIILGWFRGFLFPKN